MYSSERERRNQRSQHMVVGGALLAALFLLAAGTIVTLEKSGKSKSSGELQEPLSTFTATSMAEVIRARATPEIIITFPTATSTATPRPMLTPREVRSWCSGPCRIDDDRQGSSTVMVAFPKWFYNQCFGISVPEGYSAAGFRAPNEPYPSEKVGPISGTTCGSVRIRRIGSSEPISLQSVKGWCSNGPCKAEYVLDLESSVEVVGDQTTAPCNTLQVPSHVRTSGLRPYPGDPEGYLREPYTISRPGPFTATYCQPVLLEHTP